MSPEELFQHMRKQVAPEYWSPLEKAVQEIQQCRQALDVLPQELAAPRQAVKDHLIDRRRVTTGVVREYLSSNEMDYADYSLIVDTAGLLEKELLTPMSIHDFPQAQRINEMLASAGYSVTTRGLLAENPASTRWECFDDDFASNGWVIRPVGERRYGYGFVLDRGEFQGPQHAQELCRLLDLFFSYASDRKYHKG